VSSAPPGSTPAEVEPAPPERLGAYELLVELASGGMATVHLARATDRRQGPPLVAIKRPHRHLAKDTTFLSMLVDEARLASAIQHPNVVKVRELGFEGGIPFIVMDYIEGASLAELRRELGAIGRAIDVRVAVRIVSDVLAGLQAAHELHDEDGRALHIVHRDVSPHNVLIGCDGRSHITDFGIAKAEDRIQVTRTHEVKGKLAYLAPERVDRRRICTVQSDVFSTAVVLWECFAGRRLFRGEEAVDVLQEVMSAPIPTLRQIGAQIPPALDEVIARALSRDLERRYATALEFREAVERSAGPENTGTAADVARLMEALFGPRMALRQEQVRSAIGGSDLASLLRESGLPARERVSFADAPTGQLLAELAPHAPTGRYVIGTGLPGALIRRWRLPWRSMALAAIGIAIGASATLAVMSSRRRSTSATALRAPPAALTSSADAPQAAPSRHVVISLPYVSTHVTFDTESRDLAPPTDVVAFDVPSGSSTRHRVTALALDGTRADGYVREDDGIGRPEGDGYSFAPPPGSDHVSVPRAADVRPTAKPIGTVRNGFTKLR
jgi:serine/threonine-protein kinase